jgi:hypothetical protein
MDYDQWSMTVLLFYSCRPKQMRRPCCKALYWVLAKPSANELDLGVRTACQVSSVAVHPKWNPLGFALFHMTALYDLLGGYL